MATKKNPELKVPENEDKELEAVAEKSEQIAKKAAESDAEMQKKLQAQAAEIEKLKAQLAQNNRPTNRTQNDAEVVRQAAQEAAEKGLDPWDVKVTVRVPHRQRNEDPWYWVNINGRAAQIPADDRYQEMALPFAETLLNSLEAERMAAEYQDGIEVYDPVTNPHR